MTVMDERAIELFEQLQVPEGYKAELLRGEIVMMAGPDLIHNWIIESVVDQVPREHWHRVQTQDIAIPGEASEPQPDLVVYERGAVAHSGRLLPAPAVTLLLEVVSKTSVERDYRIKPSIYAAGQVPAYLIIDPLVGQCVLLTEPVGAGDEANYRATRTTKFGEPMPLDALGVTLETEDFQTLP